MTLIILAGFLIQLPGIVSGTASWANVGTAIFCFAGFVITPITSNKR